MNFSPVPKPGKPVLLAFCGVLATNFFWASNALLSTQVTHNIAPLHLNFWRWATALLLLLPFGYKGFTRVDYIRTNFWQLALLGLLGISVFNLLLYTSSLGTVAINISLISTLTPVTILLVSWLVLNRRPNLRQQLGMLVGMLGTVIILTRADFGLLVQLKLNTSDSFMVAAVIDWGLYSVLLVRLRGHISRFEQLTLLVTFGVVWLVVFELAAYGSIPFYLLASTTNLKIFAYLAVFPSLLAYLFWNNGITTFGPVVCGLSLYAQPVFAALLAWLLLGQGLDAYHLIAALCIGAALLLCIYKHPAGVKRKAG